jgi:hypothetical protein
MKQLLCQMKWKYHIPHVWDPPTERVGWADVWLLPDDPAYNGGSLWLTIDALSGGAFDTEPGAFRAEALRKLGDREFWVKSEDEMSSAKDCDMIVRAENFDRAEFLGWVQKWIEHQELEFSGLIEAPFEDFADSNDMARTIKSIQQKQS